MPTTSIDMRSPSASTGNFWKRANMNLLRHGTMRRRLRLEIGRLLGLSGNRQPPIVDGQGNGFRRRLSGRRRHEGPTGDGILGEICSPLSTLQTITEGCG